MLEPGKWESRSFSVHSHDDKDLIDYLAPYADKKQQSDIVRKALRFYIKYQYQARRLTLDPVLERLDRIERKLDQGGLSFTATGTLDEDRELADDLNSLLE